MLRTRFPFACSVVALTFSALPAYAQSASTSAMPAVSALSARINDIQVARTGDTISILVKLSQQPSAAVVKSTGEALTLEIDGLNLNTLNLSPPAGSLVTRVEAASGKLTLSGVAFSNPTTVIYRNAVMIEAKLADPSLPAATSLMGASIPARPAAPVVPQAAPAPTPVPVKATLPVTPAPAAAPIAQPEHPATAQPIAPAPVPTARPAPQPKHEAADQLQSHPAPAAPKPAIPAGPTPAASLAGIDAVRCATAAEELAKDAWELAAMGDHALCLIDAGKLGEAKSRIDQLGAITPQDWRVALGRALLADKAGDTETAQAAFVSASLAAPNDNIRAAITDRVSATPEDKETDIEIPLPTAPTPVAAHH